MSGRILIPVGLLLALPGACLAQDSLDTGDTAWITTATALVLFMTIPGLAMFYAGLVKSRNVLSMFTQCFAITALVTVLWVVYGYSLAFDGTGMAEGQTGLAAFVGGFGKLFLSGVSPDSISGTIPELTFVAFQLTFAIITPALMIGAFAERMKFSAVLWFTGLWVTLCYFPTAHMVWGGAGGYFADMGVFDFAGGIVVHITAGFSALVACILVGRRQGHPERMTPPHNIPMTLAGTAMLWVGVRLQRRQCAGRQWPGSDGHSRHADFTLRCGHDVDLDRKNPIRTTHRRGSGDRCHCGTGRDHAGLGQRGPHGGHRHRTIGRTGLLLGLRDPQGTVWV